MFNEACGRGKEKKATGRTNHVHAHVSCDSLVFQLFRRSQIEEFVDKEMHAHRHTCISMETKNLVSL